MSFKKVYQSLLELFPQVDSRILRSAAIEHPKDANAAAEFVLLEFLPRLSQQSFVDSSHFEDCSPSHPSDERAEHEEQTKSVSCHEGGCLVKTAASSLESRLIAKENCSTSDLRIVVHHTDSAHQEKALNPTTDTDVDSNPSLKNFETEELILLVRPERQEDNVQSPASQTSKIMSNALSYEENTDCSQPSATAETEVPDTLGKCQDINISVGHEQTSQFISTSLTQENFSINVEHEQTSQFVSSSMTQENSTSDGILTGHHHSEWKEFDGPSADDLETPLSLCGKSPQVESCLDVTDLEQKNCIIEETLHVAEDDLQSEISATPIDSCKILKSNEDIRMDFLEDIVEAAKNNKKTLFLAMESVMNMMRQVEFQEKGAEQTKEEAASAGLDILVKVEELKQMLIHAKEANDMHAGEVYGERAILATEVRELQGRLLGLSDERDNALAILDEMHQTLEARLAAAEELRKAAEKQKMEKEEAARNALAEQEAIMEKVVQESKILQQEAEENSKLREFLMDRGCVVDTLQGEISVICQDVRLLKEKFDERVPLCKSISSSQTSCILASSGSSLKSIVSDVVAEPMDISKSPKERSPVSSIHSLSPKSQHEDGRNNHGHSLKSPLEEERNNRKELLDEGWDFFENDAEI